MTNTLHTYSNPRVTPLQWEISIKLQTIVEPEIVQREQNEMWHKNRTPLPSQLFTDKGLKLYQIMYRILPNNVQNSWSWEMRHEEPLSKE